MGGIQNLHLLKNANGTYCEACPPPINFDLSLLMVLLHVVKEYSIYQLALSIGGVNIISG